MRKNVAKKVMCAALAAATTATAFAGCGGSQSSNTIRFFLGGTNSQMEMYYK